VRDSITIEFENPQAGHVRRIQDMRFVRLDPGAGGSDTLFTFRPPAGMKRVAHFGNEAPAQSDLVGKPAVGFTLPALAGGPAVTAWARRCGSASTPRRTCAERCAPPA